MKFLPHNLAKEKKKKYDLIGYVAVVIGLTFAIPQLIEIIATGSAGSVSIITWTGLSISAVFWLIYGIYRKLTVVLIAYVGYFIIDFSIVLAIIFYN
jgi:uncharacterized protein with PQ loop repeat